MTGPSELDSDAAWREWWETQYTLRQELDERIDQAVAARSESFAAALVASLIEHLAEKRRFYLHLPDSDARKLVTP